MALRPRPQPVTSPPASRVRARPTDGGSGRGAIDARAYLAARSELLELSRMPQGYLLAALLAETAEVNCSLARLQADQLPPYRAVPVSIAAAQIVIASGPVTLGGYFLANGTAAAITVSVFDGKAGFIDQISVAANSTNRGGPWPRGIIVGTDLQMVGSAAGPVTGMALLRWPDGRGSLQSIGTAASEAVSARKAGTRDG